VNVSSTTMRVLVTTGTRYYYRPSSVVGEYWRGEVAEVLERVVVVSVQVAYTHRERRTSPTASSDTCIQSHIIHTYTHSQTTTHWHGVCTWQSVVQPVRWTMQISMGGATGGMCVWGDIVSSLLGPVGTRGTIIDNDMIYLLMQQPWGQQISVYIQYW